MIEIAASPPEQRDVQTIEGEMRMRSFPFHFETHLKSVARTFPADPILRVFEGGCGEARTIGDIKRMASSIGRAIHATAISLGERHEIPARQQGIDVVVIDHLEEYFRRQQPRGRHHFVVDYCGALLHSMHEEEVLGIYGQMLQAGGTALLLFYKGRSEPSLSARRAMVLARQGLTIIAGHFDSLQPVVLVQKRMS